MEQITIDQWLNSQEKKEPTPVAAVPETDICEGCHFRECTKRFKHRPTECYDCIRWPWPSKVIASGHPDRFLTTEQWKDVEDKYVLDIFRQDRRFK